MTASVRHFLVLQCLMFWQGGFLFYTSVVVTIGTEVLGSAAAQGVITTRVTDVMNVTGLVTLAVFAWDIAASGHIRRRTRWGSWAVALVCQISLFILHAMLESLMNPERNVVVSRASFYPIHRIYLWTITVQWAACLVLAWATLRAWNTSGERPV